MQINQYKQVLPFLIKANSTALVWGHHGIGKTKILEQFCEENNYKLFNLRLGSLDTGDLLGLCEFKKNAKGEVIATQFAMPEWLRDCIDFCEANPERHAIVHLDEINRSRRDVLAPVFQMILDQRLHTFEFPKNMYITASANPPSEDYSVLDMSDAAFLDRFLHIKLAPSKSEWFDYAQDRQFDADVIGFVKDQPAMMESKLQDFSIDDFAKPSRRTWEKVSKLRQTGIPDDLMRECMFGMVGVTATAAFEAYVKSQEKPLTAEDILNDFSKHKKTIKTDTANGRQDKLNLTCKDIEAWFKKNNTLTDEQGKNVMGFLNTISGELSFTTARSLFLEAAALRPFMDADKNFLKKIREVKKAKKSSAETEVKVEQVNVTAEGSK